MDADMRAGAGALPPLVAQGPELSPADISRFARHLPLPQVGVAGQRRLRNARVLVIGAGGLGSPVLQYLAAAGVGTLTVIDADTVEDSNLQRQVIHSTPAIGTPKVDSAAARLAETAPGTRVNALRERITAANAVDLFNGHDLVIDGADNFATRYVCNDAAELTGTPLVWGTLFQFSGQVSTFWPGRGPMLRDLFPDVPEADSVPSCALGGVFGALCGWVGSLMATEAIKLICGIGDPLLGRLARVDALGSRMSELRFEADPDRPPVTTIETFADVCAPDPVTEVDPAQLGSARLNQAGPVTLVDVREDWEREVIAHPSAHAVPLGEIEARGWEALDGVLAQSTGPGTLVFMCKTGVRSATAARLLAAEATPVTRPAVASLRGGILAWAEHVHNPIRY